MNRNLSPILPTLLVLAFALLGLVIVRRKILVEADWLKESIMLRLGIDYGGKYTGLAVVDS